MLRAFALGCDGRALNRLAWLADIALTIDKSYRFPGGCLARPLLSRLLNQARTRREAADHPSRRQPDALGRPAEGTALHPVWKRWGVTYAADLATFRERAQRLAALRATEQPDGPSVEDAAHA